MAAGTVVSRFSGYLRSLLLAAALGNVLHADLFTIGNTVPNMLYILLAGGVFNAVLVPQLVRAMSSHADGGEAYTNRIITLSALFLGVVSVVLVVAAPWVMDIFLSSDYDDPRLADQRESIIAFARFCLPQVFFYGMFALVGQILNARRRFGPMMWAPIANNLVAIAVLVGYLLYYGPVAEDELSSAYTSGSVRLARPGCHCRDRRPVAGAAALPAGGGRPLPAALRLPWHGPGPHPAPGHVDRADGRGQPDRVRRGGAAGVRRHGPGRHRGRRGAGDRLHGLRADLPDRDGAPRDRHRLARDRHCCRCCRRYGNAGDLRALGTSLSRVLRTALAVIVPFAALLPVVAPDLAVILWDWGAASSTYTLYILSLSLFGVGVVFFTVHYLMLRGFYALERTRTVFFIQCAVGATNILVAVVLVRATDAVHTSPALVGAYIASYVVGSAVSFLVLRRTLAAGGGVLAGAVLVRFVVRLALAAGVATFAAWGLATLLPGGDDPSHLLALLRLAVVAGADVLVFLVLARLMRLAEVNEVLDTLGRRLGRRTRTP